MGWKYSTYRKWYNKCYRPNIRITIDPYVAPVANFGVEAYMFFEGFEGGVIPAGWTTNDVDGGWI